jgi:hypothetical protein
MNTTAERLAAYNTVMAMPYRVSAYTSWYDHTGTHVGFQTEAEARRFASLRPEPIIDLSVREDYASGRPTGGGNMLATRRLVAHPAMSADRTFIPRDDFPDTRD